MRLFDLVRRAVTNPSFLAFGAAVLFVLAFAVFMELSGDELDPRAAPTATVSPTVDASPSPTPTEQPPEPPSDRHLVAQATGPRVRVYRSPRSDRHFRRLANPTSVGGPLVFLVREERGDRLRVLLPVRPNGSQGWIERRQVELRHHRFRIVVERGAHRITIFRGDEVFLRAPVAIGTNETPTPGGLYYLKELLEPPDPNGVYGPYAYGLSGFSNELTSFAGGQGVIGIHGTNDPSSIGRDVSHGCIRMRNEDIRKLVPVLPLGTPVRIRA